MKNMADYFMVKAKQLLEKDGCLEPVAFVSTPSGISVLSLETIPKDIISAVLSKIVNSTGSDYIVIVTDTWVAVCNDSFSVPEGGVRNMPNKQDALVIMVKSKDGQSCIFTSIYKKENDKYVFDDMDQSFEPFANVFLDGVFDDNKVIH